VGSARRARGGDRRPRSMPLAGEPMTAARRLRSCLLVCALLLLHSAGRPQAPSTEDRAARFLRMSREAERRGLAEPFRGVTTNGQLLPGLFAIRSTGVSTEPVRKAAADFIATLSPEQRGKTLFPVEDDEWRKWMNQHFYVRQGV